MQADLVDMQEFAKENNCFKYLLTVIDRLSKYAWAIPMNRDANPFWSLSWRKFFKGGAKV